MTDPETPDRLVPPKLPRSWGNVRPTFRNRILTGLIFIVPLAVTFFVARWLYLQGLEMSPQFLRRLYGGVEGQPLPQGIPPWATPLLKFCVFVVTLVIIGALLWLVGSLSSSYLTRLLLRTFERIVFSIPLVRSVYNFSKQIMDLVSRNRDAGKGQRVVLVEFPLEKVYSLGFASGETIINDGVPAVTVFLPTTPNPTSGYLLIYPQSRVQMTDLTFEQAIQTIMSGGIVVADQIHATPYQPLTLEENKSAGSVESPPHA